MKELYPPDKIERSDDYLKILYKRHFQGALVRSGASLTMWLFALTAFLTNVIRINHFIGVTISVAYLILINPPTLLLLKRMTQMRLYKYGSLLINFLEILGYTAIIYFLGGIEATYITPIYAALITYVGVVSPRSFPFVISIMCWGAFSFVVFGEYFGLLPHQRIDLSFNPPMLTQLTYLMVVAGLLFVVSFISSLTGSILKKSRDKLKEKNIELMEKTASLEEAEKDLRKAQQDLEKRVEERTSELMETNKQLNTEVRERKLAEENLKEKTRELTLSNQELEQFAYVASHDLQEPLRMITSYVQLLERRYKDKLDQDAKEFIDFAVDGATRMHALINDLLTYSRVGTRGKPLEPTDCEAVFGKSISNLKVTLEESGARVTHDSLPTVMADASQLEQLFQNLIGNAIKFHGEKSPQVHVSANPNGNRWIFSVRDNGIGIEPAFQERIFVIFQRLHGNDKYPGTGIGLAVCKKIVERHGGRIWVESEPSKGATFYFTVPKV